MDRSPDLAARHGAVDVSRLVARATGASIATLMLALALGCQARTERSSSGADDRQTVAATPDEPTTVPPAAGTESGPAATGRTHRITLRDGTRDGAYCVVVDPPTLNVRPGDAVRWMSRASRPITIDINGTSPMARGHFEVPARGSDGSVVTHAGDRDFYYSLLPRSCASSATVPAIIVTGGK